MHQIRFLGPDSKSHKMIIIFIIRSSREIIKLYDHIKNSNQSQALKLWCYFFLQNYLHIQSVRVLSFLRLTVIWKKKEKMYFFHYLWKLANALFVFCLCLHFAKIIVFQSTRTQYQLVPSQLAPKLTRTQYQLVPKLTRTQVNSYPLPNRTYSTRTQVNSYPNTVRR